MGGSKSRETVFAFLALPDAAAQHVSHELLAVADAEHGAISGKNLRIDLRTAWLVNAIGAAGDDDALTASQFGSRRFARLDVRVHAQIANLPGDEMAILAARVKDGDLWGIQPLASVADLCWMRSTINFFDLSSRACASGIASMALSTSGSVSIATFCDSS